MKIIFLRLAFFFCSFTLFHPFIYAQSTDKISIQVSGGNNYYLNPQTAINGAAPAFELNLLKTSDDSLAKNKSYFLVGINYNYAVQEYKISGKQNTVYTAVSNEVLFNIGGAVSLKSGNNFFKICIYGEVGPTYSNSDEPFISSSIYAGFTGQKPNIHEFFQFYIAGTVLYGINVSERISLLVGVKTRFSVASDDLGDLGIQGNNIKYNYAPQKLSALIGFQLNLF